MFAEFLISQALAYATSAAVFRFEWNPIVQSAIWKAHWLEFRLFIRVEFAPLGRGLISGALPSTHAITVTSGEFVGACTFAWTEELVGD